MFLHHFVCSVHFPTVQKHTGFETIPHLYWKNGKRVKPANGFQPAFSGHSVNCLCRRVEKWASYVPPGAHTLGIASTQRVESGNSALKQVLQRTVTMVDVNQAILGKVRDDANKTER